MRRSEQQRPYGIAAKPDKKESLFLRDGRDDMVGDEDGSLDVGRRIQDWQQLKADLFVPDGHVLRPVLPGL